MLSLLLVTSLVILFVIREVRRRRQANLPPGPCGWPLLGVLPHLAKPQPQHIVQDWWQRYGDVFSVYMGSRLVVIVNGLEAMKECYVRQGDLFAGRPDSFFKRVTKGKGLVFSEGETWQEHRRFTLSCLRDFGMGKVVVEEKVHNELTYLIEELTTSASRDSIIDPGPLLPRAVSNIICSIIYGNRFDYSDETFCDNVYSLNESTRNQSLINLVNFLPWLEFIPSIMPVDRRLKRNVRQRELYAEAQLNERRKVAIDEISPRDYIEAYMIRMKQLNSLNQPTTFDDSQLKRSIQDLFIAGTESVSTTLKWALLFMSLHQDVQRKVQQEIDEVVNRSRLPSMSDRKSLPYTEAALMECQRCGNITLFNVPHSTLADTMVNGYRIPRDTWVFANRWGMHSSARYWKDPERFDPTRFLDEHGHAVRHEALVPFGMGPRSCLGESMAKMELFLFFSSLLQSFTFNIPSGHSVNLEPKFGLTLCPHPYQLSISPRR